MNVSSSEGSGTGGLGGDWLRSIGGEWLDGVSWVPSISGVWSWGHEVTVVVVVVVWWGWVVSDTVLGSGDITGGGVWSSGGWVGVVMWNGSLILLVAWGSSWSILWSVGTVANWDSAVDTERSVVSVAWWEGSGS